VPLAAEARHLAGIAKLLDAIVARPLTPGNALLPLVGGAAAYGAMVEAIDSARGTVGLATYIFDNDRAGHLFLAALERAKNRGVEVRVLIDGVGVRYSHPPVTTVLRRLGVAVAEFLPTGFPLHWAYANLRNHRKILVVDGRCGFTGGMNIRNEFLATSNTEGPAKDVHFRIDGPVVAHLAETFADDWAFCTGERLSGDGWFPPLHSRGEAVARGIAAGPDEDFERIRWAVLAAISQAKTRIRIVTPYFVPDQMLITALVLASLRGVRVDIVLPQRNNLRLVQWASRAQLWQLLERGCRIWQTPGPFDHSKLMTVDGVWSLIGSANWDQRSLRLNFEFNLEVYDPAFTASVDRLIDDRQSQGRPVTLMEVNGRSLAVKLRDGAAWLLSPYL
jgi:cardiolipin synthase